MKTITNYENSVLICLHTPTHKYLQQIPFKKITRIQSNIKFFQTLKVNPSLHHVTSTEEKNTIWQKHLPSLLLPKTPHTLPATNLGHNSKQCTVSYCIYIQTSNAGIIGHPDSAEIVESHTSHLPGTPGAVFVVAIVLRHRIRVIAVNVVRSGRILFCVRHPEEQQTQREEKKEHGRN